ncbi:uncharacterized protein LOC144009934 isoform X2 [Festucalex cinctus]
MMESKWIMIDQSPNCQQHFYTLCPNQSSSRKIILIIIIIIIIISNSSSNLITDLKRSRTASPNRALALPQIITDESQ